MRSGNTGHGNDPIVSCRAPSAAPRYELMRCVIARPAEVGRGRRAMVAAAFVLLMVNGCGPGSDPKLEALKDDPMARYAPAEGQLRDTRTVW